MIRIDDISARRRALAPRRAAYLATAVFLAVAAYACGSDPAAPDPDPEPQNTAPVAQAGADQSVSAGLPVSLDGSASSDADGDALTYSWSFASTPTGSAAAFDDATAVTPTFTPDVAGSYTVRLVVNDGTTDSSNDEATVTAADNTSAETIGAGGGAITSVDGNVTLDVPAGALAADTEITMTMVPAGQRSSELSDLTPEAVVYEFGPDGLQFSTPATVTLALPDAEAPVTSGDSLSTPLTVVASLSGGTLELAGAQETTVEPTSGALVARAEIDHFSSVLAQFMWIGESQGQPAAVAVTADPPPARAVVGESFQSTISIVADVEAFPSGGLQGAQSDASISPVEQHGPFEATFAEGATISGTLAYNAIGTHECVLWGEGTWRVDVEVTLDGQYLEIAGARFSTQTPVFRTTLHAPVECEAPPTPWTTYEGPSPEAIGWEHLGSGAGTNASRRLALYLRKWPGVVTTMDGAVVATVQPTTTSGENVNAGALVASDGNLAGTSAGVFVNTAPIPTGAGSGGAAPNIEMAPAPQPATGPDMSANTTDVMVAEAADPADTRVVATILGDQNIAFFKLGSAVGGAAGFVFDDAFAETFKDANGSVFDPDLPVSSYVGPNGFTPNDPMLVLTVAGDGSGTSTLLKVDLVNGKAVPSPVANIQPKGEARRIRCLENVCAISAYGTGFGFGGLTVFHWDGQSTFAPFGGHSSRSVGLDLVDSGNGSVLIGSTSFTDDGYWILEASKTVGELWRFDYYDVSASCDGPGHILFRDFSEVLLSCNLSDEVVSDDQWSQPTPALSR